MKSFGYFAGIFAVILLASCGGNEHDPVEKAEMPSDSEIMKMIPDVQNTAFYKDVFLDGGCCLNPGVKVDGKIVNGRMPAALAKLGLTYEYFISSEDDAFATPVASEVTMMNSIISGNAQDPNGVLLYPDGEPRFRAIYIFGGSSPNHGKRLTTDARSKVNQFYSNGGSYVGSCAGAYLAGQYSDGSIRSYFNVWTNGNMIHTGLSSSSTWMSIPDGSPLLKYYDFGGDRRVENIRHNGGGYMDESSAPEGTEILARFGTCPNGSTSASYYNKISAWAYKASPYSGRLAVCGSHPEDANDGEVLDFTCALFEYALDGSGLAAIKSIIHDGECKSTNVLGDGQCHHYAFYLPEEETRISVELAGDAQYDLQLYIKRGTFAFPEDGPEYISVDKSSSTHTVTDVLGQGLWFITVKCNAMVDSRPVVLNASNNKGCYFKYSGKEALLKGVPYTLKFDILK